MDQCTKVVRETNWKAIISACQSRPATKTVKQWLAENNVREKAYYYHQRKLRKAAFEQMQESTTIPLPQVSTSSNELGFVEIPCPVGIESGNTALESFHPDVVLQKQGMMIGISNTTSKELLSSIIQEVLHAR